MAPRPNVYYNISYYVTSRLLPLLPLCGAFQTRNWETTLTRTNISYELKILLERFILYNQIVND